jgi:hypothetical protein
MLAGVEACEDFVLELIDKIWPSATLFEAGSALIVEILGHDADRYPALRHGDTVNSGAHTVHTGPFTPSALVFNALA